MRAKKGESVMLLFSSFFYQHVARKLKALWDLHNSSIVGLCVTELSLLPSHFFFLKTEFLLLSLGLEWLLQVYRE